MIDIKKVRQETPNCEKLIHFNNAGAALQPKQVVQAVKKQLDWETKIGGYEASDRAQKSLNGFYTAVGKLLNTQAKNIAFCNNATDAYNRALSAISFKKDDVILTTELDYISNQIAFLALQKRFGIKLIRAKNNAFGVVDVADFQALTQKYKPVLAAVTHIPTNSGAIQDVEAIGKICKENNVWYIVDACQSAGQMPLDVEKIGCDFLSATTRKFLRGPRGAGFLFASNRALNAGLEMMLPDMRGGNWTKSDVYEVEKTALRFEYWENSSALILGAKAAVEYALELGLENIQEKTFAIANYCRQRLLEMPDMRVLDGENGNQHLSGIVTAYHPNWQNADKLQKYLQKNKINCRISPLSAAVIDFSKKQVPFALRVSPHYYNENWEVDRLVEVLRN